MDVDDAVVIAALRLALEAAPDEMLKRLVIELLSNAPESDKTSTESVTLFLAAVKAIEAKVVVTE